ncbi:MAG: hypothetical protein AAGJ95_09455 [Cyanobacteria bacterium J06554_11]
MYATLKQQLTEFSSPVDVRDMTQWTSRELKAEAAKVKADIEEGLLGLDADYTVEEAKERGRAVEWALANRKAVAKLSDEEYDDLV